MRTTLVQSTKIPTRIPSILSRLWDRLVLLSLLLTLLLLLSLLTSGTFLIAAEISAAPTGQSSNLAHHPHKQLGQAAGGTHHTPSSTPHRMRGILETKYGFDKVLGIHTSYEGLPLRIYALYPEHDPNLVESAPKDNSFPRELLRRPPPF